MVEGRDESKLLFVQTVGTPPRLKSGQCMISGTRSVGRSLVTPTDFAPVAQTGAPQLFAYRAIFEIMSFGAD